MSLADGDYLSDDRADLKHMVSPQTVRFGGAPSGSENFGAEHILFSLIEHPHMVIWPWPMYAATFNYFQFVVNSPNEVAAIQLDRHGLNMRLLPSSIRGGVLYLRPPNWEEIWTRGGAVYEGIAALHTRNQLVAEFAPKKKCRGERGVNRSSGAAVKRNALDAFMAHVLIKNQETGAGVFSAAIDQVATEHLDLTEIVWPSRYAAETSDDVDADDYKKPHYIRKYIQRESKKAE